MPTTFDYVREYLKLGWQPIPVHIAIDGACSCNRGKICHAPGKHPIPTEWQKTTYTEAQLAPYWGENPNYNVGLVTGVRTNLIAFDIDATHNGYESLRELEEKHGVLPSTTTAATGSGGRHYLFQYPTGIFVPTKGNLLPGIDIRGEGGQIVAAPSYHAKGERRYAWMPGCSPGNIMPVPAPPWLIELIREQESVWISTMQSDDETAEVYYGGSRNNNLFRLGCRLRVIKDLGPEELTSMLHALNQSKCRPPMADSEVDLIAGSVLRKESRHVVVKKEDAGREPAPIRVLSTSSLWDDDEKPIPYVIPNLLSEGEICLLASPTEAGKSLIAMSLTLSVVAGLPAWGRGSPCPPGRVMYCTEELAGRTIRRRFRKLARGLGINKNVLNDKNLLILPQQNLSLALRHQSNIDALLLKAQEFKPTLVILDTFVSYYGASEKDSDTNRAWFAAVPIALRSLCNCAVIIQHHTRKLVRAENGQFPHYGDLSDDQLNGEVRGTSDLAGVAERIWFIWKKSEERNDFGPTVHVNFRNTKAREGDKHEPILLLIQDLDENTTTVGSLIAAKSKKYREIETHLRAVLPLGPPVHIKELAQRLMGCGLSRTRAYKWLSDFIDDGILLRDAQDQCRINPSTVLV